jgi:hypothetical protein
LDAALEKRAILGERDDYGQRKADFPADFPVSRQSKKILFLAK